jgi:plastocyanin
MKRIVACAALATALLVSQAAPAAGPGPGPAQASAAKTVRIKNFEFLPGTLHVSKGTRIVFSNATAGTTHTATDKGAFDTGQIRGGKSAEVRFGQTGAFSYHCKIHPFMHGKIVVG